ncbi:TPA: GTP pyrophosphokinase family protein [Proteus mirabilis]
MSDLIKDYKNKKHLYESLLIQTKHSIESLLHNKDIEIFSIEARLKDENSFKEKLQRKSGYKILGDIEDLCGLRVICYYESDLKQLRKLITENFNVLSDSDKKEESDVDKFGYSSSHFIAQFKDEWLNNPIYSNLRDLKFEIQIRTMLMHTWAAISHKTLYKYESDAPRHMRRTFSQLSALIELADEQFSRIKEMKIDYQNSNKDVNEEDFTQLELNSDTLLALIQKYFPERKINHSSIPTVLNEIKEYDKFVGEFEKRITKCFPYITDMENEAAKCYGKIAPFWTAEGICRLILDITIQEYYDSRWGEIGFEPYEEELENIYKKYIKIVND